MEILSRHVRGIIWRTGGTQKWDVDETGLQLAGSCQVD